MEQRNAMPPLQYQRGRSTASTALWGHLLRRVGSSQVPPSSTSTNTSTSTLGKQTSSIIPIDKAGTSTRILLHDTQANIEKFMDRVLQLTADLDSVKRELVVVQKLYQEDHEQLLDKMIGLANRCQTELQKSIGNPIQSSELHGVSKDMCSLSDRIEAVDRKIDSLTMLSQTQTQALQTIQDQQGRLLAAVTPILPNLQAIPLHVENARNHVKDAVLELRQEVLSASHVIGVGSGNIFRPSKSSRTQLLGSPALRGSAPTSPERKKRRLEVVLDESDESRSTPSGGIADLPTSYS
ncbi:hypothetical protein BD414DRAFT_537097 [Trametes punicea]|nr:hypothetical protein BD414DRAFT_537097 [Trametes punicea]